MRSISPLGYLSLGLFALVLLITQPYFLLAGDPVAIRHETRSLLKHQEIGIPYGARDELPANLIPPSSEPDQYFWQNDSRQKYFSRWGLTNTLAFAIPLSVVGADAAPKPLVLALNTFNVALATILAAGLLLLAGNNATPLWSIFCVFGFLTSTVLFYYLRAQASEIIQMTLLVWSLVAFRRLNDDLSCADDSTPPWKSVPSMIAFSFLLFALVHAKVYFSLFFLMSLLCLFTGRLGSTNAKNLALVGCALLGLCGLSQLAVNSYKFGSIFEVGVGPAFPRSRSDWYALEHFKNSIPDYLWGRNASILFFVPMIIFSFIGFRAHRLRYARESALIWLNVLAIIVVAGGWKNNNGEWCLGPRYLVPALTLTVIPALESFRSVARYSWLDSRKMLFGITFALLLVFGLRRQIIANNLDFFGAQQVAGSLDEVDKQIFNAQYFSDSSPFTIARDLRSLCRGEKQGHLYALDRAVRGVWPDLGASLNKLWQNECVDNLYFWALPKEQWFN
jgi:hypothetical protein